MLMQSESVKKLTNLSEYKSIDGSVSSALTE
jgi:hypothetical protein